MHIPQIQLSTSCSRISIHQLLQSSFFSSADQSMYQDNWKELLMISFLFFFFFFFSILSFFSPYMTVFLFSSFFFTFEKKKKKKASRYGMYSTLGLCHYHHLPGTPLNIHIFGTCVHALREVRVRSLVYSTGPPYANDARPFDIRSSWHFSSRSALTTCHISFPPPPSLPPSKIAPMFTWLRIRRYDDSICS